MFHVGQLVVCVDDTPRGSADAVNRARFRRFVGDLDGLRRGTVYTIRHIGKLDPDYHGPDVRLVEIARDTDPRLGDEATYAADRFRAVDDNRIAIFRKALAPVSRKKRERA